MNYQQALEYIHNIGQFGNKYGLERIRALLEAMGNPQKKLKFVHVAGTNGKGSVCAMTESILRAAGYKTGLYISPYVYDYRERIQVNRRMIPEEDLAALFTYAAPLAADARKFEIETACAIKYFAEQECDIVVLEVGMGGRLDATNVIDAPEVAVITSISFDHMQYLGDTIEKITFEKRGIIKPGCAVVETSALPPADAVLSCDLDGSKFVYQGGEFFVPLIGAHQIENAVTAIEAARALAVPDVYIRGGLRAARWDGRMEIARGKPLCILDGAHNIDAVVKLCEMIDRLLRGRELSTVMAMGPDKPFDKCAPMLAQRSAHFFKTDFPGVSGAVRQAMRLAGPDGVVLACGSLHILGDAKRAMQSAPRSTPCEGQR